jgi:hypothetical protein
VPETVSKQIRIDECWNVGYSAHIRLLRKQHEIRIKCRVSGGVTGARDSTVKLNGAVRTFDNMEEAETEAAQLSKEMNRHSVDCFQYWAEEKL